MRLEGVMCGQHYVCEAAICTAVVVGGVDDDVDAVGDVVALSVMK